MKSIISAAPSTIMVALCATCLLACGQAPGGPPPAMMGPPKVSIVQIQDQALTLTSELPGRVTPVIGAEVRPQITGIILKRFFEEGATVESGQLLYQIDPASYRAAVDSAEAALARSKASLALAKLKTQRTRELIEINAVSQQSADESEAALRQAEADIASARAALNAQRINLQHTQITSPVSGRIGRSAVTVGALVTANQANPLATVQQLDPIYVDVKQTSSALLELKQSLASGDVKQGSASVRIALQNDVPYEHTGTLQFSEIMVDQDTDSVTLRVKVPNPEGDLLPGMYAQALIELGVVEHALLVPQQAVRRDAQGNALVSLVDQNHVVQDRKISVSRALGDQWLVTEGLQPGERLVVEGQQKIQAGSKVEVVSADTANVSARVATH